MESTQTTTRTTLRQRLQAQAERLLQAFEALPPPETYLEAERSAKALMAISKAFDVVNAEKPDPDPEPVWQDYTVTADMPEYEAGVFRRLGRIQAQKRAEWLKRKKS